MKINPNRYGKPIRNLRYCEQCGKICIRKDDSNARMFAIIHLYYPTKAPTAHIGKKPFLIVCRVCLTRRGGLRSNTVGGYRLYDVYSGQPYDELGLIPMLNEYDDPWKAN